MARLSGGEKEGLVLIYAHRGASGRLPENTLAAIRGAIDDGSDGIEFDLHATADGVPVLLHDGDLARTTSGRGAVSSLCYPELAGIDAGNGERVPTLAEALAVAAGRLRLDIEVKQPGIEAAVLADLRRFPTADWFVSSFDWEILRAFRALDAAAPLWPLAVAFGGALIEIAAALGSAGVALASAAYGPKAADLLARSGLACAVWTVNDPEEARRVRALGASVVVTDWPAAIRQALA